MCIVPRSSPHVNPEGLEGGVYLLRVGPRKFYFGVAKCFATRRYGHLHRLRRGAHGNPILQGTYNKYGEGSFQLDPIVWCDRETAAKVEAWLIQSHKSDENCANLRIEDGTTYTHSEETRKKLSESGRRRTHSEETRRKMSETHRNISLSPETRHRFYEARRKLNEARRGKALSEEHRRKLSEAKRGKRGKQWSEERRKKLIEAKRRNPSASEEVVRVAMALVAGGMSIRKAAKRVGKSKDWLRSIYRGKTYKHLNLPGRRERLA